MKDKIEQIVEDAEALIAVAERLPSKLDSDWQDSNHYELHDNGATAESGDYFWLDFSDLLEYLRKQGSDEMPCETDHGKRIGLVMDSVATLARTLPSIKLLATELLRLRDAQAAAEECVGHYADKSKWFCCGPSYLHQCDAPDDRCWFTLYEDDDEGFGYAVKAQAEIKRLKGE